MQKDHSICIKLGKVLKARRVSLGLSQETLGKRLGISFQQIQKYEKGSNQLTVTRIFQMAAVLQWNVIDLLRSAMEWKEDHGFASTRQELETVKRLGLLTPLEFKAFTAWLNILCHDRKAVEE